MRVPTVESSLSILGSIFTGSYKQSFWAGLLYLPESSSCAMILPQTLPCLTLQNLWKTFCPPTYILIFTFLWLLSAFLLRRCHLSSRYQSTVLGGWWGACAKGTDLFVLHCDLDVTSTFLTILRFEYSRSCPFVSSNANSFHLALVWLLMLPQAGISICISFS